MKIRARLILLLAIVGLCGAKGLCRADETGSAGSREELYALLNEANTAFQQANAAANAPGRAAELYGKAILLYE